MAFPGRRLWGRRTLYWTNANLAFSGKVSPGKRVEEGELLV